MQKAAFSTPKGRLLQHVQPKFSHEKHNLLTANELRQNRKSFVRMPQRLFRNAS